MSSDATLIIALIVVAAVVRVARHIKLPYTIVLVVAGLIIGGFHIVPPFEITPHLIFLVLLPPLLFEGSFNVNYSLMRRNAPIILVLAVPGVLLTALLTAALLHWSLGRAFGPLLVFGALISATDPISVLAIFKEVRAPKELAVVVEGESLFNDGTAVVLFNVVLASVMGGDASISNGLARFLVVGLGGAGLGLLIGTAAAALIRQMDDHLVEITITTIVAFGGFYLADELGLSGPLTVVAAGLLLGRLRNATLSPTTRLALESFWEYVGFLGNALVFLLIGNQVAARGLRGLGSVAFAILVVLITRALVIALTNAGLQPFRRGITWRWTPVVWWGGLRGAIALALVLSLPPSLADRDWIVFAASGVVIFSLLVEGLTMGPLLGLLGLRGGSPVEDDFERHSARLYSFRQALKAIEDSRQLGDLSDPVVERVHRDYQQAIQQEARTIEAMERQYAFLRLQELRQAERRALLARRAALLDFQQHSQITEGTLESLLREIDREIVRLDEQPDGAAPGDSEVEPEGRRAEEIGGADGEHGAN